MALPTEEAYGELQAAYDHFNRELFDDTLPPCLITFQREKRTYGYFARERFVSGTGDKTDEIAMNPAYFAVVPVMEVLQTLVHEMAHLWQFHFGKPGRRGYHNKEWAEKMEAIGLMPSDTGKEGGRKVGEKMADYPIQVILKSAADALLTTDFKITWRDRFPVKAQLEQVIAGEVEGVELAELEALGVEIAAPEGAASKSNRRKYSCEKCEINAWGKPGLNLICGDCQEPLADVGT